MNEGERHVHQPVLLEETVAGLDPASGGIFLDLSLGAGGHAEAILEKSSPEGILYGLDRDPEVPGFVLMNTAAQKEDRELLDSAEEYF